MLTQDKTPNHSLLPGWTGVKPGCAEYSYNYRKSPQIGRPGYSPQAILGAKIQEKILGLYVWAYKL